MANKTEKKIKKILSETLGLAKGELKESASFEADLNVGSTELKETISRVFEEFKVEESRTFKTVGELIDFIKDYLDELEE